MKPKDLINKFLKNADSENMKNLVYHAARNDLSDTDIAELARGLSNSGKTIAMAGGIFSDIPSTGGPSSLSTLLCPLFLKNFGGSVLKLAVPGRPAGGIDVLCQISGYNITPSYEQIEVWIRESNYVHFLANNEFVPFDNLLFNFRKENNFLNVPSLVIASLLAKKVAVGINCMGLDVRVSKFGNFGNTWKEAEANSSRFNRVARFLNIESKCFLTDGSEPQQPYIGRGESLLALKRIFYEEMDSHLRSHLWTCFSMAYSTLKHKIKKDVQLSLSALERAFFENIEVQGGCRQAFFDVVAEVEKGHIYRVEAKENGFLVVNLEIIRAAIISIQNKVNSTIFPDPCGIILKVMNNQYVHKGDVVCTFRCPNKFTVEFLTTLESAFDTISYYSKTSQFEEII